MSGGSSLLGPKEDDITKLLMASTHVGAKNVDFQMRKYVYKARQDGTNILDLHKTWEKLVFAARVLVAIENPKDITVISGRPTGQRAVLKFASHVGANAVAGRYTPGTFTNQIQKAYIEPRILVVTDPRLDHQPVREASYVNVPTIGFCNTDTPLRYIDLAIPCNNNGVNSIGLMWWLLAREILRLRGTIVRGNPWDIMPDLYFYRDPEDVEKEEEQQQLAAVQQVQATEEGGFDEAVDAGDAATAVPPTGLEGFAAAAPAATAVTQVVVPQAVAGAGAGAFGGVAGGDDNWGSSATAGTSW